MRRNQLARLRRQREPEAAALAGGALYTHCATLEAHKLVGDGQPKPTATRLTRPGPVGPVETLKDMRQIFRGYSTTGIYDFDK